MKRGLTLSGKTAHRLVPLTGWYHPPCSVLWSGEAFEAAGGWDERGSANDDGDLMMRALVQGAVLHETDRGAGFYRRLPDGRVSLFAKRLHANSQALRVGDIAKQVVWMQEHECLDRYRSALREAVASIAADSIPVSRVLAEQASRLALGIASSPFPRRE